MVGQTWECFRRNEIDIGPRNMRKIVNVVAVVAIMSVMMLGEPAVQSWFTDGAYARTSTACYRKCRIYNWSALHCLKRCRGRT